MKKALIAMSGGVDSSVAAWLVKEQGYDCIGAMMKLYGASGYERSCCSLADAEDARGVAFMLDIPFYVFNFTRDFQSSVIDRFTEAYSQGKTPNPCIDCNRFMKFERFLQRAKELDCDKIATGHYARIECSGDRFLLKKALDPSKDQSYVLYAMTQEQLSHTLLPLGAMSKCETRTIAEQQGFYNADKPDSQDICFVPDGDYAGFIKRHTGRSFPPGPFLDSSARQLGTHKGIIHYTVGQRRGLGISAPEPLYVLKIQPGTNAVILGTHSELFSKTLKLTDINLIAADSLERPERLSVKIRYRHAEKPALVRQTDSQAIVVDFDEPQRAVTPGQAAVFYDGDTVVGGGTIL